jgi:glyoxylase-like metal-dependent hydrolase (beta-lactamase superfamily II)
MCRTEMVENGEAARRGVLEWIPAEHHSLVREVEITPPTNTFADHASIRVGRQIDLSFHGRGHTNSDILVVVGDSQVVFAGDLIEESAPPAYGDAYPLDWAATLDNAPLSGTIVPGHGDVVDADFVRTQRDEIAAVAELAGSSHQDGAPIDALVEVGPYPPETMRTALTRAYAQLNDEL